MDVPHRASASRAFQSCRLRVDLERPCSTHDFVEDISARSSAEDPSQNLHFSEQKPAWVDLLDENEIPRTPILIEHPYSTIVEGAHGKLVVSTS